MHDAGRVASSVSVAVMPHIKRRKSASENSVASYSNCAVVMRYYPAPEANQMAESWVTRLESLSAEHAAKYRRRQEEEERKKRTGKGERRGNGTINELPGLDYGHALSASLTSPFATSPQVATCRVRIHRDKIPLTIGP